MRVRTVVYTGGAFWASPDLWHDPLATAGGPGWVFLGSPGWFVTEATRALHDRVAALLDLTGWHDGEYAEVDLDA